MLGFRGGRRARRGRTDARRGGRLRRHKVATLTVAVTEGYDFTAEDRAFLKRVALLISPHCLVGWDTEAFRGPRCDSGSARLRTVAALAGACGQTVLDAGEVGGEIGSRIEELTGAEVESVVCPSDVEAKAGATFTHGHGDRRDLAHDRRPADERRGGALAFEAPILPTTETEQVIATDLGDGSVVDCPSWCSSRQASRSTAR